MRMDCIICARSDEVPSGEAVVTCPHRVEWWSGAMSCLVPCRRVRVCGGMCRTSCEDVTGNEIGYGLSCFPGETPQLTIVGASMRRARRMCMRLCTQPTMVCLLGEVHPYSGFSFGRTTTIPSRHERGKKGTLLPLKQALSTRCT
jgi:hypothetical protein